MALIGNLKDIKLPSLIQLNCMEHNTAKLTIERAGRFGFVYFENGQVSHAEFDPYIGEEAVYKLLGLVDGRFKVESDVRPPVRTIHTSWSNLLLEGMHKLDHAQDDGENIYNKMFERLLTIRGVNMVWVLDAEGQTIFSTDQKEMAQTLNVVFIALQAERLARPFSRQPVRFISLLLGDRRLIITSYHHEYIMIELDKKTKSDTVIPLIRRAIGKI
ncbi:MAG TPA: DUF4388 domain-containing protein [Caldithrix abyssi]|uniref:DUF4388 domain-containing protein n=1 Tax=Caldithrix abyssi TaxID=187145 RepID=A0A7V1PTK2_CALAY|nr:DUF4388 domain-containing protein [Caldithrix abyssi]